MLCVCVYVLSLFSHQVVFNSLRPHRLQTTRLLCPWGYPGKNTRKSCHFLLQGVFTTQGLNLHLLLGKWILHQSQQGSPTCIYMFCSVTESCPALCDPMGYIAHKAPLPPHHLLEFAQILSNVFIMLSIYLYMCMYLYI